MEIDQICHERSVAHRQTALDGINDKLEDIERSALASIPDDEATCFPELPYVVWKEVLRNFTDPEEVKKLWNVSWMFRENLRKKYVEARLPEILRLIQLKRSSYLQLEDNVDIIHPLSDPEEETPGFLADKRNLKTFLNLRLVSRHCKKLVEEIFYSEILDDKSPSFDIHCSGFLLKFLMKVEEIREMTAIIRAESFNADAFFPGYLILCEEMVADTEDDELYQEFYQAVAEFLGLVGHRMRYFSFSANQTEPGPVYDRLREIVGMMPNLEKIALENNVGRSEDIVPDLENVQPFPHCPLLKSFRERTRVLPVPYVQRILEGNNAISGLKLAEYLKPREHSSKVLESLVNLTTLKITPNASLFCKLNLPWKLKKLMLHDPESDIFTGDKAVSVTAASSTVFRFLKQFEETLEHLELLIDVIYCDGEYLELGNLKTLKWKQHKSFENVDFLLFAKKLEWLYVKIEEESTAEAPLDMESVSRQIVGDQSGSFLGRSIWDVLPYLKRIQTVSCNYNAPWAGQGAAYETVRMTS